MASPPAPRRALLAGATGLIGRALLPILRQSHASIVVLVRKSVSEFEGDPKLHQQIVDYARLPALPPVDDVFIALGTTIAIAGSQAAFRAVDFDAVAAAARAGRAAGATRLGLVTALGADPRSRVFYSRVKGEAEDAVQAMGYESVSIARPSLLLGDRTALGQPERRTEALAMRYAKPLGWLIPKYMRPISVEDVAASLAASVAQGRAGTRVMLSAEMLGGRV